MRSACEPPRVLRKPGSGEFSGTKAHGQCPGCGGRRAHDVSLSSPPWTRRRYQQAPRNNSVEFDALAPPPMTTLPDGHEACSALSGVVSLAVVFSTISQPLILSRRASRSHFAPGSPGTGRPFWTNWTWRSGGYAASLSRTGPDMAMARPGDDEDGKDFAIERASAPCVACQSLLNVTK